MTLSNNLLSGMQIEKFEELQQDNDGIKLNEGFLLLENLREQIIITFHYSFLKELNPTKRILLNVSRKANFIEEMKANFQIKSKATLLVNYSTLEYAHTFELTVNSLNKSVHILLKENPYNGNNLITNDERKGIRVYYT